MYEIKMPQLGQSVEEASIVSWLRKEGDTVSTGDPLFLIQTDKAEIECEATATGVLRKILLGTDVSVPVLTVVALVGAADEPLPDLGAYGGGAPATEAIGTADNAPTAATAPPSATAAIAETPSPVAATGADDVFRISPRALNRAGDLDIDPKTVAGTGVAGRVIEADVLAVEAGQRSVKATPTARRVAKLNNVDITATPGTGPRGKVMKSDVLAARADTAPPVTPPAVPPTASPAGPGRRVPLTPMRRIIAQRMVDSKFAAPHYYMTVEVDMTAAKAARGSYNDFKPTFNDIVMRATAIAIGQFPQMNARWMGDAIEEVADINLGFAVALPAGLIVPVVRCCQTKTLRQIHDECQALGEKAKSGKLLPNEYSGNTFTISNLGSFGIDQFTAIINQPDSAILAVGQIKNRPVVVDGGIFVRPIMKMTLSSDHRVIDGAVAAQFMGSLKRILETGEF